VTPILSFALIFITAKSAADLGGPLFWPMLAALGASLGFAAATLYFILFQRDR